MRELTYFVAVSLDGRIAGPDGDFSMFPTEGDHIEMIFDRYRDTLPTVAAQALGLVADRSVFDTVVMGWNTYAAGVAFDVHDPYPHLRQYVATRRDDVLPAGITTTDDPLATVRALKAEPAGTGIWLCGGGALAATLAAEIDRLVLKVNPVVVGAGVPLFDGAAPTGLRLEASTPYRSGVVVNEYRVDRARNNPSRD